MKLLLLKDCYFPESKKVVNKGEVVEVADDLANKLVAKGTATTNVEGGIAPLPTYVDETKRAIEAEAVAQKEAQLKAQEAIDARKAELNGTTQPEQTSSQVASDAQLIPNQPLQPTAEDIHNTVDGL